MPPPLCNDDRRQLLLLARSSLTEFVLHNRIPHVPESGGRLAEPAGAFVTLWNRGRLRGCVGSLDQSLPLTETVVRASLSAARDDPRFAPVCAEEIPDIEIEISVLSEPRPIAIGAIEVGKHGLQVIRGKHRGLLLPQVAAERSWSAQRFVEETCLKAALAADAWKQPDTEILGFTADVFSERELHPATTAAGESRGLSGV